MLAGLRLLKWQTPASLLVLFLLGCWTLRHRAGDVGLIFGVTAIVARFWTYHRVYDDLLILLPMVALFPIATPRRRFKRSRSRTCDDSKPIRDMLSTPRGAKRQRTEIVAG